MRETWGTLTGVSYAKLPAEVEGTVVEGWVAFKSAAGVIVQITDGFAETIGKAKRTGLLKGEAEINKEGPEGRLDAGKICGKWGEERRLRENV